MQWSQNTAGGVEQLVECAKISAVSFCTEAGSGGHLPSAVTQTCSTSVASILNHIVKHQYEKNLVSEQNRLIRSLLAVHEPIDS
ncbi:hypothetical protein M407DRAFT_113224 [Tulasnella calospora MUT 4182]|uniref:Uncharacterized protein n=1 Tax=Tulasnella calospora MUT 4182 TaxID=1051891 RepID=A0A0C3QDZ5_9AGAM|nr:hypothetical protein M407DRAFT_113224 [Tulasnella calospora MUT 4182]